MKEDSVLYRMIAVLPKKFKNFSARDSARIYNEFKLDNEEIPMKNVEFSFDSKHYRY